MRFTAVVFDVDGTLYPNYKMYLASIPTLLTNFGLVNALEAVRIELRKNPEPGDEFHRVQARHLARHLGVTPERAYALVEARIYTRWYKIFRSLKPFPGLVDTLEAFRVAGIRLGVLSDFPIRGRLRDLGLDGWWKATLSSEETGYLKPHPESFTLLAERLGVSPQETLYVGNSYRYDVLGAKSAGMAAAHLTPKPHLHGVADFSFEDYRLLRRFVLGAS
jgi:putative hydrolase of the HAD superfamily